MYWPEISFRFSTDACCASNSRRGLARALRGLEVRLHAAGDALDLALEARPRTVQLRADFLHLR
jgi:hypothetical protein